MMKQVLLLITISIFILQFPETKFAATPLETIIIEVEGDVEEHQQYIEKHHPFIDVIASYSTIFNGIALEGKPEHLTEMENVEFIKGIHDVHIYGTTSLSKKSDNISQKSLPLTNYTGKNIKVAVIDTGIDYTHPDLERNYMGGYDVFDFDADPMETLPEQGVPTSHGTHVAGIIAANGELKGVAPDAEIYAYRALGPAGYGSTVHVLAALEQAVLNDVDIINLSLGNNVNGPDYPTSVAVNKAVEFGIPVVIANGNSGPEPWTVGAPATAEHALSVGAATEPIKVPYLYHPTEEKKLPLPIMQGSHAWNLTKAYQIVNAEQPQAMLNGKIALYERGTRPFIELATEAQENGAVAVLISNNEEGVLHGGIENQDETITIPVVGITQEAGGWLVEQDGKYIETIYQEVQTTIADFSSRGPVTVNWQIKPDILAPGTNIQSTVPDGYERLSGTSMAAPYVAGSIALIKEAHPNWNAEKIYNAVKTTATPLIGKSENFLAPSIQGHGYISPKAAIETETIIYDAALEAGKITSKNKSEDFTITIENLSQSEKQYTFDIPKKHRELNWKLPLAFAVQPQEKKEIEIELDVSSDQLKEGVHEGYLELVEKKENKTFFLPYLFVNQTTDQPKTQGFEFSLKRFSTDTYAYSIYATEALRELTVDLYDPDTLHFKGRLIGIEEVAIGMNEGEIVQAKVIPGIYAAVLTATTEEGVIESYEIKLGIE